MRERSFRVRANHKRLMVLGVFGDKEHLDAGMLLFHYSDAPAGSRLIWMGLSIQHFPS